MGQVNDRDSLKNSIGALIEEYGIPGICIAIITDQEIKIAMAGNTKAGGAQIDDSSFFHLASNTKAITAMLMYIMDKKAVISLDTPIVRFLKNLDIKSCYQDITIRQLLSHQAGIAPYTSGIEYMKLPPLKGDVSERRMGFCQHILSNEECVAKGTYSNAGYALSAMILENNTARSFEKHLDEMLSSFEMKYIIGFPNRKDPKQVWGHLSMGDNLIPTGPEHFYKMEDYMLPAGDLSMTINDYARFVQMNLTGLRSGTGILSKEDFNHIHFGNEQYGLGWGNLMKINKKISYHDGTIGTFYSHSVLDPDRNIATVILINSAHPDHIKAIYKFREQFININD